MNLLTLKAHFIETFLIKTFYTSNKFKFQ